MAFAENVTTTSPVERLPLKISDILENAPSQYLQSIYYVGGQPSSPRSVNNVFKYCGMSLKHGRPLDTVMIVMAGQTGAGKSSTINCLFDDPEMCPVNNETSETPDVIEYRKTLLVTEEKPTLEADLCFVDMPGTLDVDSTKEASNFNKIKTFRDTHIALAKRKRENTPATLHMRKNVYPNLVLLVLKPDSRMKGPDSFFMKTLKCLKEYKLVDKKYPNLLVVVTHALQLPPKIYSRKKAEITNLVQREIFWVLSIRNVQVVFVENSAEDYNIVKPEGYDFYQLPNGEFSHHNLMQAMIELFKRNSDFLGRLLCGWYFKTTCPEKSSKAVAITMKQTQISPLPEDLAKVEEKLAELGIVTTTKSTGPTETITKSLHYLETLVGYGYCPVTETIKHINLLRMIEDEEKSRTFQIDATTFKVAGCVTPCIDSKTRFTCLTVLDQEIYQTRRKVELGLQKEFSLVVGVDPKGRWVKSTPSANSETVISFLFEKQLATIKFEDPKPKLPKTELIEVLKALPDSYNGKTRALFQNFFRVWGTHAISEQGIGGAIQLDLTVMTSQIDQQNLTDIENQVKIIFDSLCGVTRNDIRNHLETSLKTLGIISESLSFSGGQPPNIISLQSFTHEMFQDWVASINSHPAELEHNFKLLPYYNFVDPSLQSTALTAATIDYMGNAQTVRLNGRRDDMGQEILEDVKSESSCFPSFTQVRLSNGNSKPISCLTTKDKLCTINYLERKQSTEIIHTNFQTFLHKNDEVLAEFLAMTFSNGKTLVTSASHLLFCYDGRKLTPKRACNFICNEDKMMFVNAKGEILTTKLISTRTEVHKGVYAPLTTCGTFMADGFLVSCYADVDSFRLAHAALAPLRLWGRIKPYFSKGNHDENKKKKIESTDGIHRYPKLLLKIKTLCINP